MRETFSYYNMNTLLLSFINIASFMQLSQVLSLRLSAMYSAMMHAFSKTNCAINGRVLKITLCNAPSPLFLWCHLKSSQFDLLAKSEMPQASPTGGMAACFSQNCEKNEAAEMCPNTCTFCSKLFTVSEKRTRSKFYLEGQLILWVLN